MRRGLGCANRWHRRAGCLLPPPVLAIRSRDAQIDAEIWARSRASNAANDETVGTVVVFTGGGNDEVLLRTAKVPVLGKATVSRFGTKSPERVSLKAGAARDDKASTVLAMDVVRITVAKVFFQRPV